MTNGEKFKDVFGFDANGSRVIAVNSTWWDCDFQIRKPKIHADLIRAMTNEELAEFVAQQRFCAISPMADKLGIDITQMFVKCRDNMLVWLRQEASND